MSYEKEYNRLPRTVKEIMKIIDDDEIEEIADSVELNKEILSFVLQEKIEHLIIGVEKYKHLEEKYLKLKISSLVEILIEVIEKEAQYAVEYFFQYPHSL